MQASSICTSQAVIRRHVVLSGKGRRVGPGRPLLGVRPVDRTSMILHTDMDMDLGGNGRVGDSPWMLFVPELCSPGAGVPVESGFGSRDAFFFSRVILLPFLRTIDDLRRRLDVVELAWLHARLTAPQRSVSPLFCRRSDRRKKEAAGVRAVCAEPIPAALRRDGVDGTAKGSPCRQKYSLYTHVTPPCSSY